MKSKWKGWLSIILMSFSFFMMSERKYSDPLGDYLLKFIGLKAWTQGNARVHLTVIYFGILFVISLVMVRVYAVERFPMKRRVIFLVFIAILQVFTFITDTTIKTVKASEPGLLAIGYIKGDSHIHYSYKNKVLTEFSAKFELTNYSNEVKSFNLAIVPFDVRDQVSLINFYTVEGEKAVFELWPKQSKTFNISLEDYKVDWNVIHEELGSGGGSIKEIILSDEEGNSIKLNSSNLLGERVTSE
jgi:hypothetical protein